MKHDADLFVLLTRISACKYRIHKSREALGCLD